MTVQIGDIVAIRGDRRLTYQGNGKFVCSYFPEQLVDGKYLRHTGHGGIWTGVVVKVEEDRVKVGGGWWGIEMVEVITKKDERK